MMTSIKTLDRKLLFWAYGISYRSSVWLRMLIFMGDGPFWMLVLLAAALAGQLYGLEILQRLVLSLVMGFIITNAVFNLCKTRVRRWRPYADRDLQGYLSEPMVNRDPGHGAREQESFPSGHALWTTLSISLITAHMGITALILLGWMIPVMMFLRLYLGVHYPSDVLAGALLGLGGAGLAYFLTPILEGYLNSLKGYGGYLTVYWVFLGIFMVAGFRSWLKRV